MHGEAGPLLATPNVLRRIQPTPSDNVPPRLLIASQQHVCVQLPVFQVTEHFRVTCFDSGIPGGGVQSCSLLRVQGTGTKVLRNSDPPSLAPERLQLGPGAAHTIAKG